MHGERPITAGGRRNSRRLDDRSGAEEDVLEGKKEAFHGIHSFACSPG